MLSYSRLLRECMATARPHTILQLAWESRQTFFQPSPQLLSTVIAAQVGSWVRESDENEAELVAGLGRKGMYHIMDLALRHKHIGLTMERIRELHEMKFSVINPVTKIMEECQKGLNYHVDADILFFFLATYGELFGPDYEPFLNPALPLRRRLKFETRLKFVQKYIPGAATESLNVDSIRLPDGSDNLNGRRMIAQNLYFLLLHDDWCRLQKRARQEAGARPDFDDLPKFWTFSPRNWRQSMLEDLMNCQGLEGLGMMIPGTEIAERYKPKIREWRDEIERLNIEPRWIGVDRIQTREYPNVSEDLIMWVFADG